MSPAEKVREQVQLPLLVVRDQEEVITVGVEQIEFRQANAHVLDKNLAVIRLAGSEQVLLSKQIAANFAGLPFQESEVAAGGHIVLQTNDAFGLVGPGLIVLS